MRLSATTANRKQNLSISISRFSFMIRKYFYASIILLLAVCNSFGRESTELLLLLNDPLRFEKPQTLTLSEVGKALVQEILKATSSIDFALYGIRNQDEIYEALVKAKKRGVRIRGIVDKDVNDENYYTSTPKLLSAFPNIKTDYLADRRTALSKQNFKWKPYCDRPYGFEGPLQCIGYSLPGNKCVVASHASREPLIFKGDLMHNKFFIIDELTVWTGSTNASDSGTGGYNANNAVLIKNRQIADWFKCEFEQMYIHGKYHRSKTLFFKQNLASQLSDGTRVELSFSPQGYSVERLLRPLIKNAHRYIDVSVFFFTHKKLAGDLIAAHQRGVKVRVIIDATSSKNGYTKHEILRVAGIPVKVENWGGKMHMKSAVIDGEIVITGSMNWTSAGERDNDENTLIIHGKKYAQEFHEFFNRLWVSIPNKWLYNNPDPESLESSTACYDGVDNDFDGLIDELDPGCTENPPILPELPPYRIVPKAAGYNLIKGNISKRTGNKIYQVPGTKYYDKTHINLQKGEKWFCSIYDARENGWKSYREYK